MEQELISRGRGKNLGFAPNAQKRAAIIGAGPAGCICAYYLQEYLDVTLFDKGNFLRTLLPTGGGRCNLAHAEYDFKELAKNYPRGEKFLYSVFSRFSTKETLEFFKSIEIETYVQDDNRIFPVSNSAKDVREKLLKSISKCTFQHEKVEKISKLENGYKISTPKSSYYFDIVVIAIGGHAGFGLLEALNIKVIEPTQALVGLLTKEDFATISGVCLKHITAKIQKKQLTGDIIFTHKGISGPLIYKLSSIFARKEFPYKINLQIIESLDLQQHLNKNPHKEIKNLLGEFIPKSFANWLLKHLGIPPETPSHKINGTKRDKIANHLDNFEINITGKFPDGEVVTCGGVDLKEVNSKTLESKTCPGLYFCGEVLDIDGFCGGFNLQNCWSTGYVTAESIKNNS